MRRSALVALAAFTACTCGRSKPKPPAAPVVSSVTLTATSPVPADGRTASALLATVLDQNGAPMAGRTVKFASSRSGDTVTQPAAGTDAKGQAKGALASAAAGDSTVSLTVDGKAQTARAAVHFTPAGPPTIGSFVATPSVIAAGGSSTLSWSVTGAGALAIDQGVGDVTGQSSAAVTPAATTTYTLTATNAFGSATAQATVTVGSGETYELTGLPASATAGAPLSFALTVRDSVGNVVTGYTGTVHFTSTDPAATLPADYAFTAGDQGAHAFSVTFAAAGNDAITAADTAAAATPATQTVAVSAGPAASLAVSGIASPTAVGVANDVTVEARDAFGNTAAGYAGAVHFTSSDPGATLPSDYTFASGDAGRHTFAGAVAFATAGTQSVTATDAATASITGAQTGIAVAAPASVTLAVSGLPSTVTAGAASDLTVKAVDGTGAVVTTYAGTVHLTSSDGKAVLAADYTFTSGDAGVHVFAGGVTLETAGAQSVHATDASDPAVTGSQTTQVAPAAASIFLVSVVPSTVGAGAAAQATVTADDAYGNVASGYAGAVHFTSTDGAATLPADYAFTAGDAGTHVFSVTFNTLGAQTVTVADKANGSVTGTSNPVTVNCGGRTIDGAQSTLVATAGCLTVSTGALSGVEVDLKDASGSPITGAQVTFSVAAAGLTFPGGGPWVEAGAPAAVEGVTSLGKGRYYLTLRAPTAGSGSITVSAQASWPACGISNTAIAATATVTTAAPNSFAAQGGGVAGCPAGHNVRVQVVAAESGNPLGGAHVLVGGAENAAAFAASMGDYVNGNAPSVSNVATADTSGYAEFHDFSPTSPIAGRVAVTAVDGSGARTYGTLYQFDAADLVVPLELLHPTKPATYTYTQQGNPAGTFTTPSLSNTVPDCSYVAAAIAVPDVDLDFFAQFNTSFLGRNQCINVQLVGAQAIPSAIYLPAQSVSGTAGFCVIAVPETDWAIPLSGTGRIVSFPFGYVPFSAVSGGGGLGNLLGSLTFDALGFKTGINGGATSVSVTDGDTFGTGTVPPITYYTMTIHFPPGWTRPGGANVPDLLGLTGVDTSNGSLPPGAGRLVLSALKELQGTSAVADIAVPYSKLANGGSSNPTPAAPFGSLVAAYLGTTPAANKSSATSAIFFRNSPYSVTQNASTVNVDDLLAIAAADPSPDNLVFTWGDTKSSIAPGYSRSDLVLETIDYPPTLGCETTRQAMSTHETQWIVWKPYDTTDAACTGSECFTLPTPPAGWPRAGDGLQQLAGFEPRAGSGKACASTADCQASLGESCNDLGNAGTNLHCTLVSGTDFIVHKDQWILSENRHGLNPSFSATNFSFGSRLAELTHVSGNRRDFTVCASNADCTAPAVCDQTMSCR